MWFSFIGLIAAAIGTAVAVPQIVRLSRSPHANGVSYPSALLGVLMAGTWLAYGTVLGDLTQVVANLPGLVGMLIVAVLVARRTEVSWWHTVFGVVGWVALAVLTYRIGGPMWLGFSATVVAVVRQAPQLIRVLKPGSLAGLAPSSYLLAIASATLWTVYGIGTAQPPVWGAALTTAVISTVVLARRLRQSDGILAEVRTA